MTLRLGENTNTTNLHEGDELLTLEEVAEFLRRITAAGFTGDIAVEVNTRRGGGKNRDVDLAESLAFARTHCAVAEPHV